MLLGDEASLEDDEEHELTERLVADPADPQAKDKRNGSCGNYYPCNVSPSVLFKLPYRRLSVSKPTGSQSDDVKTQLLDIFRMHLRARYARSNTAMAVG